MNSLRRIVYKTRQENGIYFLEAVIATPIVMTFFLGIIMAWFSFVNAMLAINTLSTAAIHASSSGTWTQQQQFNCEKALPGTFTAPDSTEQDAYRYCKVFVLAANEANPQTGGIEVAPFCKITTTRTKDAPYPDAGIKDCLNLPPKPGDPDRFSDYAGYGGSLYGGSIPIRVEVAYRQAFLPFCFLPRVDAAGNCTRDGNDDYWLKRSIVVYSQTRRET